MPRARALVLALATLLGCGHADAPPPAPPPTEPAPPAPAAPQADPLDAPPPDGRTAAREISFAADEPEPEPTAQIRGAPQRPPIPRFRLFGTREGDGP
jgi:hypothetical protein